MTTTTTEQAERAAFEAEMLKHMMPASMQRSGEGYAFQDFAWIAWKARAALATPPAAPAEPDMRFVVGGVIYGRPTPTDALEYANARLADKSEFTGCATDTRVPRWPNVRALLAAPAQAEPPKPVAWTTKRLNEWVRNHYQDYPNIDSFLVGLGTAMAEPVTAASEPEPLMSQIESPFNACMYREYCKGLKRAASELAAFDSLQAKANRSTPPSEPAAEPIGMSGYACRADWKAAQAGPEPVRAEPGEEVRLALINLCDAADATNYPMHGSAYDRLWNCVVAGRAALSTAKEKKL